MEGLTDVKDIDKIIKIGKGGKMRACKTGNLKCEVTQLDEKEFVVNLSNVKYAPEICSNLFHLNKTIKYGFKLSNDKNIVSLTKKHITLTFDCMIKTLDDGCVTRVMMRTISAKQGFDGFAHASIEKKRVLTSIAFIEVLCNMWTSKKEKK
jgi:hypothetical protein